MPKNNKTNIRERNGKFHFRYSVEDAVTGKRKQKETPGFKTFKEAKAAGTKILAELLNGNYIEPSKVTVGQMIEKWFKVYSAGSVKEQTINTRTSAVKMAVRRFGGRKVSQFTVDMYQEELVRIKNDGYGKSTILNLQAVMKMAWHWGIPQGLVQLNIAKFVRIPDFSRSVEELERSSELPDFFEKEELKLFLENGAKKDPQFGRFAFVLAYTGMRIGELLSLRVTDIDELNRKISITKTLYVKNSIENYVVSTPKNETSIRKINFGKNVAKVLREQKNWRNEYKLENMPWFQDEGFLFCNTKQNPGYPLREGAILNWMKEVLGESELPTHFTPHSLRHTFTSLMAEAGVELEQIQKMLGHKNDEITRRVYLHITRSKKLEAVEKFDALMDEV